MSSEDRLKAQLGFGLCERVGDLYEKYEIHQMVVGIASARLHYVNILA